MFLTNPNNPTGGLIREQDILTIARTRPAGAGLRRRGLRRLRRPDAARPGLRRASRERHRRPHLRQGLRAGRPPGRRGGRSAGDDCAAAAHRPAVHAERRRRRRAAGGVRGRRLLRLVRGAGRGVAAAALRTLDRLGVTYWPSHGNFVLARFGARPAGGDRRPGRAGGGDPRPVARSGMRRLRAHHHRGGRTHASDARTRWRRFCAARHSEAGDDGDVDRAAARPGRQGPLRGAAPASASSITCWSWWPGTAAST